MKKLRIGSVKSGWAAKMGQAVKSTPKAAPRVAAKIGQVAKPAPSGGWAGKVGAKVGAMPRSGVAAKIGMATRLNTSAYKRKVK